MQINKFFIIIGILFRILITGCICSHKNNGIFESLSWEDVELSVKSVARSLLDIGILKGDRVIILSENRPEWQIADLAIMSIGAITVPVYTTSTTEDYSHVINHSGARCIIISSHELCLKALPAIESSTDCKNVIKINEDDISYKNPVNILQWKELVEKNTDDAWKNIENEEYKNYSDRKLKTKTKENLDDINLLKSIKQQYNNKMIGNKLQKNEHSRTSSERNFKRVWCPSLKWFCCILC